MVVILAPLAALTGIEHERTGRPFMWTVQAPHCATPQPYLVPVRPICSRITQSRGVVGSTSTSWDLPLIVRRIAFLHVMRAADAASADCIVGKYEPKLSVCHYPAAHNAAQQESGNAKRPAPSIIGGTRGETMTHSLVRLLCTRALAALLLGV